MSKTRRKGKIFTFDEILGRESLIFIDTSIETTRSNNSWHYEAIYAKKKFSNIDTNVLERVAKSLGVFLEFLYQPRVYTVSGVCKEVNRVREMIEKDISIFRERKRPSLVIRNKGKGEESLWKIFDLYNTICLESERSLFVPAEETAYKTLERLVFAVTEATGAKIKYDPNHGSNSGKKDLEDFHADEQLVANALYISYIENKSSCIVTRDSDIKRILENTLHYLARSYQGRLSGLVAVARMNRVRDYYMEGLEEASCSFDTRDFDPKINIRKVTPEIIKSLDRELRIL